MDDNLNIGFADIIKEVSDDFLGFVSMDFSQELCEECSLNINNNVLPLLDFDKPRVMVYGIYNSGKSTLINALMRREVAEMADRPMTDKITEFDRGEYILIDSPGVDAPIQHEEITSSYINKCHVILFVISSKGGFESKKNYEKMAELLSLDIPFIIVLNERGCAISPEWTQEEKTRHKMEYESELKEVQYKIIENLKKVTGNKDITDNYEVYVLNAKKALKGILENKSRLYELSHIDSLESRIDKLVQGSDVSKVIKAPILNLKRCFDIVEKNILDEMKDSTDVDYSTKIEVLRRKQDNLKDEMRITIRHETERMIDEITAYYLDGDYEILESSQSDVFGSVEEKYTSKLNELMAYVRNSFVDIEGIDDMFENTGLYFETTSSKTVSEIVIKEEAVVSDMSLPEEPKKKFLQSKRKYEEERRRWLEERVEIANMQSQQKLNEELRARQQARQSASSDMFSLQKQLIKIFNDDITEKFNYVIEHINQIVCENQDTLETGKEKLEELKYFRARIDGIENKIF